LRARSCREAGVEGRRRVREASKRREERRTNAIRRDLRVRNDREGTHKVVRHRSRLFLIAGRALGPFSLRRMRHDILLLLDFSWNLESCQDMDWGQGKREGRNGRPCGLQWTGTKSSVEICKCPSGVSRTHGQCREELACLPPWSL
jgi:hypothetical protein